MRYTEKQVDLFTEEADCYVQCISSDLVMGAGIAVGFNHNFDMKGRMVSKYGSLIHKWKDADTGFCVYEAPVYNLITKRFVWEKPTLDTLRSALIDLREQLKSSDFKKVVMPKIGCGLDRLNWADVSKMIKEVFEDLDIEIVVCYLLV